MKFSVIDARAADRFEGRAPEPRPGLQSGHIPGNKNVPFMSIVDMQTGKFIPKDLLLKKIEDAGVDLSKPIITTCGSGVTAAVVSLALSTLGKDSSIYDGSFTEWGDLSRVGKVVQGKE